MSTHFEIEQIKTSIDCREVAESFLGKPLVKGADYLIFRCPFHVGKKGSFTVWRDGWKCWADCQTGGDVIELVRRLKKFDRAGEAIEFLQGGSHRSAIPSGGNLASAPDQEELPPNADFQLAATAVMLAAESVLWSDEGVRARNYLYGRGLTDDAILEGRLGYVPGAPGKFVSLDLDDGLTVSVRCGITIPWVADNAIWGVKVRVAAGTPKYRQLAGNAGSRGLYFADKIRPGKPALIVEGEFDALIVWQEMGGVVSPLALGSASNTLGVRWQNRLMRVPRIYARLDDDPAGRDGLRRLKSLSLSVIPVQMDLDGIKDLNDLHLSGVDLLAWFVAQSGEVVNA